MKLKSIFGLREIIKNEEINYEASSFFLQQSSLGAEAFDFGIKIKDGSTQFLKLYQATSEKTDPEKEKISLERIIVYSSYLKKAFKENKLGELNGISFGIISPSRILDDTKNYQNIKEFCKNNNYEFILYDISSQNFFIRDKGKNNCYNNDLYKINENYSLPIINFEDIINIKNFTMLSTRKVKKRDEDKEDENSTNIVNTKLKDYLKKIKRVSKLEYHGKFSDINKLHEKYFCYIYDNDNNFAYFYKDKIVDKNYDKEENEKPRKITLILYSSEIPIIEYNESSLLVDDIQEPKNRGCKKNKKKTPRKENAMKLKEENEEKNETEEKKEKYEKKEHRKTKEGKNNIITSSTKMLGNKKKNTSKK